MKSVVEQSSNFSHPLPIVAMLPAGLSRRGAVTFAVLVVTHTLVALGVRSHPWALALCLVSSTVSSTLSVILHTVLLRQENRRAHATAENVSR
ncbi:MAG: hypothetical protein Q8Q09_16720 [Deltaproteobacteria bacterium]|nr:hypothetical protein [Deltaproteobacteria bacterium]